jgi:hypothetical protein
MHRLVVDSTELLINELKPVIRIVEAHAVGQIGDRSLKALPEGARTSKPPRQVMANSRQ